MKRFIILPVLAFLFISQVSLAQDKLVMTKNGVGPVKVGINPTIPDVLNRCKLPASCDNLYDELVCDRNQFEGGFEICGRLNGQMSFVAFCGEEDTIENFFVTTPTVVTAEGLSLNSTAKEITAAGATFEKKTLNDNGTIFVLGCYLKLKGLYYFFSSQDLAGQSAFKDDAKPVAISNFPTASTTEYLLID